MSRFLSLLVLCIWLTEASAQNLDSLNKIKSEKDSVRYTRLKERMSHTKFSRRVYKIFFRDVYNKGTGGEVSKIEVNPFNKYEGLTIGSITIKSLQILGESVYDTTRKGTQLERFVSKNLHTNTRERIIRKSFLLFTEGDEINPEQLQDNERLLRSNPTILDARILVVPRKSPNWIVDIVVLVQDVWSLNVSGSLSGPRSFQIGLENTNVRGYAHSHYNRIKWNALDTLQKFQFRSIYTIPYIGKTFITGQASLILERDLKQQSIRFSRSFLRVTTKYAGAVEVGHYKIQEYRRFIGNSTYVLSYPVSYNYYDFWVGRAFKVPFGNANLSETTRFVVAFRTNSYDYNKRPEVRADTNKIYWNRKATLASIGYSSRRYERDLLVYGFGRTEDVPIGSLFSLTIGRESTEYGERGYGGIQFASGHYLPNKKGYLYGLFNYGSYYQGGKSQQGLIDAQLNYFSNLTPLGLSYYRQFINLRYTSGINRDPLETINISRNEGIRGVSSDQLIGTQRLTLGLEGVLFSLKSILGFRLAHFAFADFGMVTGHNNIFKSSVYQGYGLGVRLRNENLTLNTFQIRIGYYPNIPGLGSPFRYGIEGMSQLYLRDFDISAPTILPFK